MKLFLSIAALSGFLSVALGAFGAHALREKLDPHYLDVFKTGVQYQMYHTLALLAVALLIKWIPGSGLLNASGWLFIAGILIFSGSLYILSVGGIRWMGAITPIGGLCFLAGWALLFWQAIKLT